MGLLDGTVKDLSSEVVTPALDKVRTETIPALGSMINAELTAAIAQTSNVIQGAEIGLQATVDSALMKLSPVIALATAFQPVAADIHALLAKLNAGETVEITVRLGGKA
jgi:hypothetical protein